ncbi:DNA-binding storekeeper protein-related transcriptional regulator [Raphanus sativus]|uniref:Probable transcription factor At1g11510 n=1 Tax=Raphanus sativus TaxID=3726 RepID=A0A6J0N9M5_RAPSA|nr:probable transcription factor At1g11510 [Raphanus sativus]KAJ4902632.1 DNA-binding storekeeper protein-related transcriptional regulator [Raphanus sativus]
MSGKLLKKLEDPPMASSSSEEENEDTLANASSPEEEATDSESEAEPVANPPVKPPADSKKVETSSKPETKKRSSDKNEGEPKRAKRVSGEDNKKKSTVEEETKKNSFQRVWSGEDEIAVLQGIINFKNKTGSSPYDDKNALYDMVKKSVSFDVTKTQFMEKIRALKKKFESNLGKGKKKKGKDPSFSKAHDRRAFDLAKLVWGDNGIMALESSSSAGKSRKVEPSVKKKEEEPAVVMKQEFVSVVESVARFGVDDVAAKKGWSRLSSEDKERFEKQWKALQIKEFNFYAQKSGFIHEVVTKMAEASGPKH